MCLILSPFTSYSVDVEDTSGTPCGADVNGAKPRRASPWPFVIARPMFSTYFNPAQAVKCEAAIPAELEVGVS